MLCPPPRSHRNRVRTGYAVSFSTNRSRTPFHSQILHAIKPGDYGKQINVQAPRGTGKTTLVNRLIPIWRICYKEFDLAMGRQPEEFILIVGRNETMARQRMSEISNVLERNPLIRADFGDLVGDPWAKRETNTSNGVALRPLGRGSSPRGALIGDVRPTLKLCDDIEDPKRRYRRSEAMSQSRFARGRS